jgi:large subunit ribosomal protein L25
MTTEKLTLNALKRDLKGKKVKRLRKQGLVVGNIVISGKSSVPIKMKALDFKRIYEKAGESTLVYLHVAKEEDPRPVLIDEVVPHPTINESSHVVLKQVSLTKKIEASIHLEITGELIVNGAVTSILKDEVEVSALPTDLPESFEIDAGSFTEIGQKITLADLDYDKSKVELVLDEDVKPEDVTLILIQEEKLQAEEPEEEVVEEVEGAEGEKKTEGDEKASSEGGEAKSDEAGEKKE